MNDNKVLIVTNGLLTPEEASPLAALNKQLKVHRNSEEPWLDLRIKLQILERILPAKLFERSRKARKARYFKTVSRLQQDNINLGAPELTEVILMTLLAEHDIRYEATTYVQLSADHTKREQLLSSTDCVFASATMLRGMPEVKVVADLLKRKHNHVVLGGALTGVLHKSWPGVTGIDLLAVGYGEWLVPSLVDWIRSGYQSLSPPPRGHIEYRGNTPILYSGLPDGKNLDDLSTPDWSLAERYHKRKFPLVHYESVRGCPYRCAFCNYPYLFADDVFRTRSAHQIARDWLHYSANGARIINCLDSLFTVPRGRLLELCETLRGKNISWICYARADDLARPGVVEKMIDAGCIQVQIGIESGNQQILDNMNKQCSVETNLKAMKICREHGLTTMVTVIIGFPGETSNTVEATLKHLRQGRPDFYYAAPFSVLIDNLPILSAENRVKFGLQTNSSDSPTPYWRHDTMDAATALHHVGKFNERMMQECISLEGSLFYSSMTDYNRDSDREDLLSFQHGAVNSAKWLRFTLHLAGKWIHKRLRKDMKRALSNHSPTEATGVFFSPK